MSAAEWPLFGAQLPFMTFRSGSNCDVRWLVRSRPRPVIVPCPPKQPLGRAATRC